MAKTNILSPENIKALINAMKVVFPTTEEVKEIVKEIVKEETKHLPSKDDFYTRMDKLSGELKAKREEQELHSGQHTDMNDSLENHETRISDIEKKSSIAQPQT